MKNLIDALITKLIYNRVKHTPSEVFNSIRINAIVDELHDSGLINNDRLDKRIQDSVMGILGSNKSA